MDLGNRINACGGLQALLEQGPIVQHQQPLGHVDPAVGVDADQVVVEGGVVDLGEGDSVCDHRLSEQLVGVGHDVGGIEEVVVRQVADRAPVVVGGEHAVPEGCLVQPLLDQAERVAALGRVGGCRRSSSTRKLAEQDARDQTNRTDFEAKEALRGAFLPPTFSGTRCESSS